MNPFATLQHNIQSCHGVEEAIREGNFIAICGRKSNYKSDGSSIIGDTSPHRNSSSTNIQQNPGGEEKAKNKGASMP
ncbi:hypothetical protein D5086_013606 [Populus alba]|uniref:Uncharacterized protein n=1 Tax=Populus alba TaxID=43335 RepID=A0ACC4C876_POPAL